MEDVLSAVMEAANELYQNYLKADMASGKYPSYKASGMAYIRFAREENKPIIELIQRNLDISEENAYLVHLEMWIYVHGMATMPATSYLELDEEFMSRVLTDGYEGMKTRYLGGRSI